MELHSEGKPLVQTLVDFFQEVEQQKYETRVLKRLDVIIGMLTAIITSDPTAFGFATTTEGAPMSETPAEATQGSAETVEGDQVVVNEASPGGASEETPEGHGEAEDTTDAPEGDAEGGDADSETDSE